MKKKIFYGSILSAFLMISIAFMQPIAARESRITETIRALDNITGILEDEDYQVYLDKLGSDEDLHLLVLSMLCSKNSDELDQIVKQFVKTLESNPAFICLKTNIQKEYGKDLAVISSLTDDLKYEETKSDMNGLSADESNQESSLSNLQAPDNNQENNDLLPPGAQQQEEVIGIPFYEDMYPVYAPFLGLDPLDPDGDGIYEISQTIYSETYEGPIIHIVQPDVWFWVNEEEKIGYAIPGDIYQTLYEKYGDDLTDLLINLHDIIQLLALLLGIGLIFSSIMTILSQWPVDYNNDGKVGFIDLIFWISAWSGQFVMGYKLIMWWLNNRGN